MTCRQAGTIDREVMFDRILSVITKTRKDIMIEKNKTKNKMEVTKIMRRKAIPFISNPGFSKPQFHANLHGVTVLYTYVQNLS